MLCEKFEEQLQLRLDQRERPEEDAELQEHAALCTPCREQLSAQRRLFDGLSDSYANLPDSGFTAQVIDQVVVLNARDRRRRQIAWGVVAALAAALLIALLPSDLLRSYWPTPQSPEGPSFAQVPEVSSPPETDPEQYGELLNRLVRDWPEESANRLEPVDQIAGGFRTLASTIHVALDALRSSLPAGEDPEPEDPRPDPLESLRSLQRMLLG